MIHKNVPTWSMRTIAFYALLYLLSGFQLAYLSQIPSKFPNTLLVYGGVAIWFLAIVGLGINRQRILSPKLAYFSGSILLLYAQIMIVFGIRHQYGMISAPMSSLLGFSILLLAKLRDHHSMQARPFSLLRHTLLPFLGYNLGFIASHPLPLPGAYATLLVPLVIFILAQHSSQSQITRLTTQRCHSLYWLNVLWFWTSISGYLILNAKPYPIFHTACLVIGMIVSVVMTDRKSLDGWRTNSTAYWLILQGAFFVHAHTFPASSILYSGLIMAVFGGLSAKVLIPSIVRLYRQDSALYFLCNLSMLYLGLLICPHALLFPKLAAVAVFILVTINCFITDTPSNVLSSLAAIFQFFLHRLGVRYLGTEHLDYRPNERVIIIANHSCFLDVPILASRFHEKLAYPIYPFWLDVWVVRVIGGLVADMHAMKPGQSSSLSNVIDAVRRGKKCIIFPEGRLSDTGNLMKLFEGTVLLAEHSKANIQPAIINGGMNLISSRDDGRHIKRFFAPVQVTFGPSTALPETKLRGKAKRKLIKRVLFQRLAETYLASYAPVTVHQALCDAARRYGYHRQILQSNNFLDTLTYRSLLRRAGYAARRLRQDYQPGDLIGISIETGTDAAVLTIACMMAELPIVPIAADCSSKTFAEIANHLNFSAVVIDRQQWHAPAYGQHLDYCVQHRVDLLDHDQLLRAPSVWERIKMAMPSRLSTGRSPDQIPAVLWFNSDSHQTTVLSHHNLTRQAYQLHINCDLRGSDVVFNAAGLQTTYGILMGLLHPLLSGVKTVVATPGFNQKYVIESFYDTQATVLVSHAATLINYPPDPDAFYETVRMRAIYIDDAIAPAMRSRWEQHCKSYLFRVFCDPNQAGVVAINSPYAFSDHSYGRLLPGTQIHPVSGGRSQFTGPICPDLTLKHQKISARSPSAHRAYTIAVTLLEDEHGFLVSPDH